VGESSTRDKGRAVEGRVAWFLRRSGLRLVARNVELAGVELDLIARDPRRAGCPVVFIEVRSRASDRRGDPAQTVGPRKQARLIRGATAWLLREGLWERVPVRFDVVSVLVDGPSSRIRWIENAFDAR